MPYLVLFDGASRVRGIVEEALACTSLQKYSHPLNFSTSGQVAATNLNVFPLDFL